MARELEHLDAYDGLIFKKLSELGQVALLLWPYIFKRRWLGEDIL